MARLRTLAGRDQFGALHLFDGACLAQMVQAALETGVLDDFPSVVSSDEAHEIPRQNLMLRCTGSQGERRAATAQLANGKFQGISLKEGDMVLLSSSTIPGNERDVIRIMNQFSEQGVDVVTDRMGDYHVSGHANRPDLMEMHKIIEPQMVIPMQANVICRTCQIAENAGYASLICVNGMMLDLSGNRPKVTEYVETGRMYLDGSTQIGALDGVIRGRLRMALYGHVIVTVILDEEDEMIGEPWCEVRGLPEMGSSNAPLVDALEEDLSQFIGRADHKTITNDDKLEEAIKRIARQTCQTEIGKKPEVSIVISRLM